MTLFIEFRQGLRAVLQVEAEQVDGPVPRHSINLDEHTHLCLGQANFVPSALRRLRGSGVGETAENGLARCNLPPLPQANRLSAIQSCKLDSRRFINSSDDSSPVRVRSNHSPAIFAYSSGYAKAAFLSMGTVS